MSRSTAAQAVRTRILRWRKGKPTASTSDQLAREEPLEIRVGGKSVAVTMRTPGHDEELAVGFLLSEGLLRQRTDLIDVATCTTGAAAREGNILNVFVARSTEKWLKQLARNVYVSSSCGLCGKASIDAVHQKFPPVNSTLKVSPQLLQALPARLRADQRTFERTGGLHGAALFDAHGKLLVTREDVGRHNAVDKVLGHAFLKDWLPLSSHILLVSGRASFEIVQKALSAGIPVVAAVSAPSSLAVEFARESNQTLVGFLRERQMNVYAGTERVAWEESGLRRRISRRA